jgi:hypothetical protein
VVFMTFVLLYLLFLKRADFSGQWYNNIVTGQLRKIMSRYGTPSRKLLSFLNKNPGATSGEINEYLHGGRTSEQLKVRYKRRPEHIEQEVHIQWQAKRYVLDHMVKSRYYYDVEILDERVQPLSKICRGNFAYLTSPYHSRTLAADPEGRQIHRGAVNRRSQRKWFYRVKGEDGRFRYFLTLVGMAALPEHGIP